MARSNGWGDGSSNNTINWGQCSNNAISWGSSQGTSWSGLTDITGVPLLDSDAQAFITAAAITDATQQSAIDTLVTGLKTDGLWTKMKAIYPFVGGTATAHKFNLKDPRDLDAAFRLTFSGGWAHSSTGATPNGVNGYGNTNCKNNINLANRNSHYSVYLRTLNIGVGWFGFYSSIIFGLQQLGNGIGLYNFTSFAGSSIKGFILGSVNLTNAKLFNNGITKFTSTSIAANTATDLDFYIGALNSYGQTVYPNTHEYSFTSLGDNLSDTEATNYNLRVQAFQTTLSRQV